MQYFVLVTLAVVMSVIHFVEHPKVLPPLMAFTPEALAGVVLLCVVVAGGRTRFRFIRAEYWLVFGGIAAVMVCGIVSNNVGPGPIFAGLRYYLRPIPLFFLPAVFAFSPKQIRQQLKWMTLICCIQLPLAIKERLSVIDQGRWSGDSVVGSLEDSGALSIFLISAFCMLIGLLMRKQLSNKLLYLPLFAILLFPTMINETKATLILLPIGLLITMLVASPPDRRLRVFFSATALLMVFFAIFAPVYDYLERGNPYRVPITDFFLNPSNFMHYLDNHADAGSAHVARLDGIKVPLAFLEKEPSHFAFGVGIGNASHSQLGEQFTGRYFVQFAKFELSSMSSFLLEIGLLGTTLVFVLYWMIFRDSLAVARMDRGIMGGVAAAWAGIVAMMTVSMPYNIAYTAPSLSFLFWYFSGLVAAQRMYLVRASATQPAVAQPVAFTNAAPGPVAARTARPQLGAVRSRT